MADKRSKDSKSKDSKVELTKEQFDELMNRLNKVENSRTAVDSPEPTKAPNRPGIDFAGRPTGIVQKYTVDPKHYVDPREELKKLKELKRFAFDDNYMLDWDVENVIWDSKWGTSFSEPRFKLVLYKKMFDDDTGEETNERLLVRTGYFFEDPAGFIKEAQQMGLPVEDANSDEFLEKMRFQRYKSFLMDLFFPEKNPGAASNKKRQTVIGGKVVQIEEYNKEL